MKSSGAMKKLHRGQHVGAGRRGEPKELIRGDSGSQKKLATACRKVFRRAAAARRKGNLFRKILTQGICGPLKQLAVARREMIRLGKVARRRGHDRKRYNQHNAI
jgi:hypothetical protein